MLQTLWRGLRSMLKGYRLLTGFTCLIHKFLQNLLSLNFQSYWIAWSNLQGFHNFKSGLFIIIYEIILLI